MGITAQRLSFPSTVLHCPRLSFVFLRHLSHSPQLPFSVRLSSLSQSLSCTMFFAFRFCRVFLHILHRCHVSPPTHPSPPTPSCHLTRLPLAVTTHAPSPLPALAPRPAGVRGPADPRATTHGSAPLFQRAENPPLPSGCSAHS